MRMADPNDIAGPASDDVPTKLCTRQGTEVLEPNRNDKPSKRARVEGVGKSLTSHSPAITGNGGSSGSNEAKAARIIHSKPVPILGRDAKVLLLDIEGSMTSLSYVHSYMQQFVLDNLESHIEGFAPEQMRELAKSMQADMISLGLEHAAREEYDRSTLPLTVDNVVDHNQVKEVVKECVRVMIKHDVRRPEILSLQGAIWKKGKNNGTLEGHIYPDFIPTIKRCRALGVPVCIFAAAPSRQQKRSFATSSQGDLTPFISSYFDTSTSGPKTDPKSYKKICKSLSVSPNDVLFLSVDEVELRAAKRAGLGFQVKRIRPANWSVPLSGREEFPVVSSMLKLLGLG